ncbi:hypothetical protein ACHAWF_003817 [Thalassiosira exigua]
MYELADDWIEEEDVQRNHFIGKREMMEDMMPRIEGKHFSEFDLKHLKHCLECEPVSEGRDDTCAGEAGQSTPSRETGMGSPTTPRPGVVPITPSPATEANKEKA